MLDIKSALRSASSESPVLAVDILDIQKETGFTQIRVPAVHAATGNQYIHLLNPETDKFISVKVGSKAEFNPETMVADLINNNVIYYGENANGLWFTFGRKATLQPTKIVSFASLLKGGVTNAAMAQLV